MFALIALAILRGVVVGLIRDCQSNVCLNGGTCKANDSDRTFRCQCPTGFAGLLCEKQTDCSLPCLNGGTCILDFDDNPNDRDGLPKCLCPLEFSGILCEIDKRDCQVQGCPGGERCVATTNSISNKSICIKDPCSPNPCNNNGTCNTVQNKFECKCAIGFDGSLCDNDIDECIGTPCKNGAICSNTPGSFTCLCNNQFRGRYCEEKMLCDPNPCMNDGHCVQHDNEFRCECMTGFSGKLCQDKREKCNCRSDKQICVNGICKCPDGFMGLDCDKPVSKFCTSDGFCKNNGKCNSDTGLCSCLPGYTGAHCEHTLDCTVNGGPCLNGVCLWSTGGVTTCECNSGFTGQNCESSILDVVNPCKDIDCNGGKCEVKNTEAVCICPDGRQGQFCQILDVCSTNPCLNGGKCFNANSIGGGNNYLCVCNNPFTGTNCEELTSNGTDCVPECADDEFCAFTNNTFSCSKKLVSCDDCVHSKRCIQHDGQLVCVCEASWTGAQCDQPIQGCTELRCAEYQICRYQSSLTGAHCGCSPGLRGQQCSTSTAVTFHSSSFLLHQSLQNVISSAVVNYELSFAFRTTLLDTQIVTAENILSEVQFALEIHNGHLFGNFSGSLRRKLLPFRVNDDRWYTVVFNNTNRIVWLEMREDDFVLSRIQLKERRNALIFWTRFGKGRLGGFNGCIRDLIIDGQQIQMTTSSNAFGVIDGCHRTKQCSPPNPCQNGGRCIDEWNDFRCECSKPFVLPYCIDQIEAVTFGHNASQSRVELDVVRDVDSIKLSTDIDFIVRTNQRDNALIYLGEKNDDNYGTFLSLAIVNGSLSTRSRLGGKRILSRIVAAKLDDNREHLIRLNRQHNLFTVYIDEQQRAQFELHNRFDYPLLADIMVVGSSAKVPKEAFGTDKYFKGTIQDLRVNKRMVPLGQLPSNAEITPFGVKVLEQNVLQASLGSVTDDLCGQLSPCINGKCTNTFNDFECQCESTWTGEHCDQVDHCVREPCPQGTKCTNFHGTFICNSPATFVQSSWAKYQLSLLDDSQTLKMIRFKLRSRSVNGLIIQLWNSNAKLQLLLENGQLLVEMPDEEKVQITEDVINDGDNHEIIIDSGRVMIDGQRSSIQSILPNLDELLIDSNTTLIIGQSIDHMQSFEGCIEDVIIGEKIAPLSFSEYATDLRNASKFDLKAIQNVNHEKCISEEMCGKSDLCRNGGVCEDQWNKRYCHCKPGYTGDLCQIAIDRCENNRCKHGVCLSEIDSYRCECHPSYVGQFCDEQLNLCKLRPCLNNGNCSMDGENQKCECPSEFIGQRCQTLRATKCESSPCENGATCRESKVLIGYSAYDACDKMFYPIEFGFNNRASIFFHGSFICDCPSGFTGDLCDIGIDHCVNNPCKNRAQCISKATTFECLCAKGFQGRTCTDMKDECISMPCVHGKCRTILHDYLCECESGWRGARCDLDDDECLRYPCLNAGNCTNLSGSYHCDCPIFYLGNQCEILGSCLDEPCGSHGKCVQHTATEHSCSCNAGYTGISCETEIDYCTPNPCTNSAKCIRTIGGFHCVCLGGFTGITCETDIDDCVGEVCKNGGKCTDRVNGYSCDCDGTGHIGIQCTDDLDECEMDLCANGTCTNTIGSFICECFHGYIGVRCNVENPCTLDKLNRSRHDCLHGQCINPSVQTMIDGREVAAYQCDCETGYSGEHCIHPAEINRTIPLSYVAGPMLALVTALVLFACVLLLIVTVRGRRALQGTYSPSTQEASAAMRLPMNSMLKAPPEERLI